VLALSVSLPPKLRMTSAQTEHMPFYLRVFFRVLSSWVRKYDPGLGPTHDPTRRMRR
jgi:hypothetical protein